MTPTFGHDFARNQPNDMSQYLKRDISNYKADENWRGDRLKFVKDLWNQKSQYVYQLFRL